MNEPQPVAVNEETLGLASAELRRQLGAQIDRKRLIETEATVFLGLFAVMVSVVIGQWLSGVPWGYPYLQLLGVATLLGTLVAIILTLWPRDLHLPPDPERLIEHLPDSPERVELSIATERQKGYAKNGESRGHDGSDSEQATGVAASSHKLHAQS